MDQLLERFYWEKLTVTSPIDRIGEDYLHKNFADCEKWIASLNEKTIRKIKFLYQTLDSIFYKIEKGFEKELYKLSNQEIEEWWVKERRKIEKESKDSFLAYE